jgi:hypothetical protein
MTITEQTDYALKHPAFKRAIENYNVGYQDDIRFILITMQKEAAARTKEAMIRCYGQWKRSNIADIQYAMKIQEIPSTMDYRMPIVNKAEPVLPKKKLQLIVNQYDLFAATA